MKVFIVDVYGLSVCLSVSVLVSVSVSVLASVSVSVFIKLLNTSVFYCF